MITAVPYVKIENAEIRSTLKDAPFAGTDAVALAGFTITYGRDSVLDQPSPGKLSLSLLVRPGYKYLTKSMADRGVQVWIRYTVPPLVAKERRIFLGRVRTGELTYLMDWEGAPVYRMDIDAADPLTDLERQELPYDLNRPEESWRARVDAIAGAVALTVAGIGGTSTLRCAPRDLGKAGAMAAIRDLFNSTGEAVWYDPHTNRIEANGHAGYGDGWGLLLRARGDGSYSIVPRTDLSGTIRPREHRAEALGGISYSKDQQVTEVLVSGKGINYNTNAWYDAANTFSPGNPDGWKNRLSVDTQFYEYVDVNYNTVSYGLGLTGAYWTTLAKDAAKPVHPPVRCTYANGFDTEAELLDTLQGKESREPTYAAASVYNQAITMGWPPVGRVIGGAVSYVAQEGKTPRWETERRFAFFDYSTPAPPVTGATINPSTTQIITFAQLDDTVTGGGLAWTFSGV